MALTQKQTLIKACRFARIASDLRVEAENEKLPERVRDLIREAHKALREAEFSLAANAVGLALDRPTYPRKTLKGL